MFTRVPQLPSLLIIVGTLPAVKSGQIRRLGASCSETGSRYNRAMRPRIAVESPPFYRSGITSAVSGKDLGHFRRARMLHQSAKELVRTHCGRFPQTAEALQTLPGIGRYTAAAIASIA